MNQTAHESVCSLGPTTPGPVHTCVWCVCVCVCVRVCVRVWGLHSGCVCVGGGLQGVGVYVGVDASGYIEEKKNRSTCSPSDIFSWQDLVIAKAFISK